MLKDERKDNMSEPAFKEHEADDAQPLKFGAEVDDDAKTVKLAIPGGVKLVLEFDQEAWCAFYELVWKVNNTLLW